ncbi:type III secretion system translocator chaperone SicA [Yokenella regensburgei]|uniref:type III secretion system translocator chaperone SicA n=1 Tax=Yokenella regensburgei TaxID=158877 RepID=UPI0014334485|nr:type III secretion system translocator chaperone SicA [Yokenella regensburgei]QIU92624.1 type III secretion system translocator chaperone SicA [Yokenella regensburgei]
MEHGNKEEYIAEMILEAVISGETLKDIYGIPKDIMDGLYAYAYDFYQKGSLDEAEAFFRFLSFYDFYNPDYIVGLAAVYQLKKQFQKACDLYAVAFALSKNEYRPVFHAGQCLLFMQKIEEARLSFELVREQSSDETLVAMSQAYLDSLSKKDTAAELSNI